MFKIKNIFLTSLLCILISTNVSSEDIEIKFRIYCEVIDNVIVKIEDGESKRFSGWEDGFSKGDSIHVEFDFSTIDYEFLEMTSYSLKINTNFKRKIPIEFDQTDFSWINEMDDKTYIQHRDGGRGVFFGKDTISIDLFEGEFTLTRYYRDDWSMIYTNQTQTSGQVIVSNCMSVPSKYKEMFDTLLKINSKT